MKKYIFLLAAFIYTGVNAQNIHTGYHSEAFLLQSSSNAASMPKSNFVFGLGGLSSISTNLQLPLSLNEVFEKNQKDSLQVNFPSLISNLEDHDAFYFDGRLNLLHLGFKLGNDKNVFVYFGDEIVMDFNATISGGIFDYLTKGNAYFLDQKVNFDKERFDAVAYNSFYLGAAVAVDERLKLGLRLKYLTGIANLHTDNFHLGLQTSSEFYQTTIYSDMMIKTSGIGDSSNPISNSGFAIDLGAIYQATEDLELSVALNDIGSINWAEENNDYFTTGGLKDFELKGVEQSSGDDDDDLDGKMDEISDSLSAIFELNELSGSYNTKLKSNLFLGAKYQLTDRHSFSFLLHSKKHPSIRVNTLVAGYQLQLGKALQLLASYKNFNGISNVGGGIVWSPGPIQFHMIMDNALLDVFDLKNLGLQMGLVFRFGRDE